MSLGAHLVELRRRLTTAAVAIVVAATGGFFATDYVIAQMRGPITEAARSTGHSATLNYTVVTQAFDLKIQIALTLGIVVSSPVWLYQLWAFVVPGLMKKERAYAVGFLATAVPLFLVGCFAGWTVMPHIVQLMLGFVAKEDTSLLDAKYYYDFVLKLMVATGIAFVLPVFLVLLNFVGVLSARAILKGWRIAVLLICLFTAIATPAADVISMFLLAVPMVVLYLVAAGVSLLHDRRALRQSEDALTG
jgi:sec-independent protein translocase protein TatC